MKGASPRASARADPDAESLAPGEFLLTRGDFRKISEMIHSDAGIDLSESKAALVYARLAKRMRALRLQAFADYCDLVAGPEGATERQEMLAALTTNVTRFFREPHHFEHLKSKVLPSLLPAAARGGRVRIWSAACSSGQEPYSIALTILAAWPEAINKDVKVLATDIDPNMVAAGRAGAYTDAQIEGVSADQRKRFFEPPRPDANGNWRAGEALRRLVAFRSLNLIDDWPMRGAFHAIFCRNVVIYFDEPTQQRVWQKFLPRLEEGGYLYIGHSERVTGPAASRLRNDGVSTYRLIGASQP
jgi:chemotaxis protein methyltransferase CheR